MKRFITLLKIVIVLAASSLASAQQTDEPERANPFIGFDQAAQLTSTMGLVEIRSVIAARLKRASHDAQSYLLLAELMKRTGDSRAEDYYQKAIDENSSEPAYELFYSDYLRNFRGPGRPLFDRAEKHYLRAQTKLRQLPKQQQWDHITAARVERGLVALYQEDGVPVVTLHSEENTARPLLFFSSSNRFARLLGDFDNVDDIRGFTSEALLAASRLSRDLPDDVLQRIVRVKDQFDTVNRFRVRYKRFPVIDLSYRHRGIERSQITNFFEPTKFNRTQVNEFGFSVEKTFAVNVFDLSLRGGYKKANRQGGVEFLPRRTEKINQYEARAAVSRFVGPDKTILEAVHVFQDIDQDVPNPIRRDRRIIAAKFTYELLRFSLKTAYLRRFETRGVHFFAGILNDKERFGTARLVKNDYFIGSSLKGLGNFEITLQPTIFTSRVDGVIDQRRNSQYRTDFIFLWRIRDEEKEPGLPERVRWLNPAFIHVVIPFKHDLAIQGLNGFENYRLGIALDTKFFRTGSQRTTFLASASYNYQRYYKLNKNLNLLSLSISMGF